MAQLSVTGRYFCECGGETDVFMEGYQAPSAKRTAIHCWKCDGIVGFADAARVWTGSTPQSVRQRRLQGLHQWVATQVLLGAAGQPDP